MRQVALGLVLLLAGPLLSGCIFSFQGDPGPEVPELLPDWILPRALDAFPPHGAYGVWVPENVTGLRVRWPETGDDAERETEAPLRIGPAGPADVGRPHNLLGHFPDLLVIIGPDGTWRHLSSGRVALPMGPDDPSTAKEAGRPTGLLFHEPAPDPGLYRFVVMGQQALPVVELKLVDETTAAALAPLPLVVSRTILDGPEGTEGGLGATGPWTPPAGTVVAWGALHGVGFDGTLSITNTQEETVAEHRRITMTDPTTANLHEFGLRTQDGLLFRDTISPDTLYDRELVWTTTGTGRAVVYGLAAVAEAMPAPWAPSASIVDPVNNETTPLAAPLSAGEGGAFVLPEGARVALSLDGTRYDHARYRVYDAAGTRLAWGTVDETETLLRPPPGPLAIVNDGPGRIAVDVVGPAPADAVLHRLETESQSHRATLGAATGGPDEAWLRVVFTGPVVHVHSRETGNAEDLEVAVHREDGGLMSTLPDRAADDPRSTYCCSPPIFAGYRGDAHWLDPGVHRARLTAAGGTGDVFLEVGTLDLSLLDTLAQDGN